MNHQQDHSAAEMDFPVEATVHLDLVSNKREAMKILQSHGFERTELGDSKVRIKGYFSQLRAVKLLLAQLDEPALNPAASSGTISSYYNDKNAKSRSLPRDRHVSPTSPTKSYEDLPLDRRSARPKQWTSHPRQQGASPTRGRESFAILTDVYMYALHVRRKDIETIETRHGVELDRHEDGESSTITVTGRNPKMAASELRSFLVDLGKRLRTQDVLRHEMNGDGLALLEQIQKQGHVYKSVFVSEVADGLHLVGPSIESFKVKQQFVTNVGKPSGRAGWWDRDSRIRSSSLPSRFWRKPEGQSAAAAAAAAYDDPSLGGAAGYSPPNYHHGELEGAKAPTNSFAGVQRFLLKRSRSERRPNKVSPPMDRPAQETTISSPPPISMRQRFKQLFSFKKRPKESKKLRK